MITELRFLANMYAMKEDNRYKEAFEKANQAFDKGIDCILQTQILVEGKPSVWCAQHDGLY